MKFKLSIKWFTKLRLHSIFLPNLAMKCSEYHILSIKIMFIDVEFRIKIILLHVHILYISTFSCMKYPFRTHYEIFSPLQVLSSCFTLVHLSHTSGVRLSVLCVSCFRAVAAAVERRTAEAIGQPFKTSPLELSFRCSYTG